MRIFLKYGICFLLLLNSSLLHAQMPKEANVWYFGRFLGLDFNSGTAVPLNDGQTNTTEGVATISNANGNLLFYTDGITVWNRLHQVMPNGTGLFGDASSTQSAVIVPVINDLTRYYVFTVDQLAGPNGLRYSIVNMTLAGGNGDVEVKNVALQSNVVEKVTAVRHCNNRDIWVVAHGAASNIYYSFLVSPTGINTIPVISNTGTVLPGVVAPSPLDSSSLGYMKISPNGRKIAAAHWTRNVDVSDFNNATGVVSNTYSLAQPTDPYTLYYGVEFSPDSKLVYATAFFKEAVTLITRNQLRQYDVTLGSAAAVRASLQVVSQNSDPIQTYAALQVAPDGKMYMAKNTYANISSIDNPNVYGSGCNFVSSAVQWSLPGQRSSFGLPTFVQSYFYPADSFTYVVNCPGLSVNFYYTPPTNPPSPINSLLWKFGDPASGANNTSTQTNPVHVFSAPGIYTVDLIKFTGCGSDTIRRQVSTSNIAINLGPDTIVCGGTSVLLNPSGVGSTDNFIWQDGSTNPTFTATIDGLYWVEGSNSMGCRFRDSINVTFKTKPIFSLGNDRAICVGDTITLNATVANAISYLWNTGAVTPTIKVYQAGTYWCDVSNGCVQRDDITITAVNPKPVVNFGADISTCAAPPILLDATNPNSTYLWQDGSTNPTFSAATSGLYWAQVTNSNGCIKRDSINIAFNSTPVFNLGADRNICQGDTLTLNATVAGAISYLWNNGATTPTIKVFQAGTYWCEVNNGCTFRDDLTITSVKPKPTVNLGNDVTVCEGITVSLNATFPAATYLWQDGSTNPVYNVSTPGTYFVIVDLNGCNRSDTVIVNHNLKPRFTLGQDQVVCAGSPLVLAPVLNPAWQLSWQDGSALTTFTITNPGSYSLTATNNCGPTTDGIVVSKGVCKVFMPTGFTPNNDGKNDYFKALGTETVTKFDLKVYNRWGQIVFQTTDKSKGWNGKFGGMEQSSAVFIYLLQYTDLNSPEPQTVKGTFVLIR